MWASAGFHPHKGEHIVGREREGLWLIKEHEGGKYTITTANDELRWWLDDSWPETPITLHNAPPSDPQCQWTFQEIVRVDTGPFEAAKREAAMVKAELEQAKVELARTQREAEQAKRKTAKETAEWEETEVDNNDAEGYDDDAADEDEGMDVSRPLKPRSFEDKATSSLRPRGYKNVVRSPSGQELREDQQPVPPDADNVPIFSRAISLSKQGSWQEVVHQGLKAIRVHSDLRHENQDGLPETELLRICTLAMHAHNELEAQGTCNKWCQDVFLLLQTLYDLKPRDFRDALAVHLSDLCLCFGQKAQYKEAVIRGSQSISLLRECSESNPSKYHPLYTEALTRLATAYKSDAKLFLECLITALLLLEELCAIRPEQYLLQLAKCLVSIMYNVSDEQAVVYANKAMEVYERMCKEIDNWMYRDDLGGVAAWAANAYARLLNFKMAVELAEKAIHGFSYSGSGDDDGSSVTYWRKQVAAWKSKIRPEEEEMWKEQAKKLKDSYQSMASQLRIGL